MNGYLLSITSMLMQVILCHIYCMVDKVIGFGKVYAWFHISPIKIATIQMQNFENIFLKWLHIFENFFSNLAV